jgi:uncharacterized protein (DUF1015 family)
MPNIRPFKAVIYNKNKVGNISKVVAPPYDIIPPKLQDALYRAHPNNFVRIELNKIKSSDNSKDNRYTRANKLFQSWLGSGILVPDEHEAIYVYSEQHKEGAKTVDRIGFISLIELDMSGKKILPHENTLAAPKLDRLDVMRALKANLSPIFVLYDDASNRVLSIMKKAMRKKPVIDANFDNVKHRIWKLTDPKDIQAIQKQLKDRNVFIADGHHRYEVARTYCREIQKKDAPKELKQAAKYMMAYFVSSDEKMLSVLPTHRMIKDMNGCTAGDIIDLASAYFSFEKVGSLSSLLAKMDKLSSSCVFGMYIKGSLYLLKLKDKKAADKVIKDKSKEWKSLDVAILHHFLFRHVLGIKDEDDNIEYTKDASEARSSVDKGGFKAAFILNPTKVSQIKAVARLGECMPKKATYFYPKPASGLVVNRLG